MRIPVNEPVVSNEAKQNVAEALKNGWLSSSGPFVEQFEQAFARYLGRKHAVSTSSGTAALHIALLSHNIGAGDEVIVPSFAMGAVWLSVLYTGAKPVFVDCEPKTLTLDPARITERISKRTKAIIVMDTYGHPADMDTIMDIAQKHGVIVIEDAAEAHGAKYKNKRCGSLSDTAAFSFYANKLITTGEGGMVVTDNDTIAQAARRFKDLCHSQKKRFVHDGIGYNYRMTNLQAAVGLGELTHIEEYVAKKRRMADQYNAGLAKIQGLQLPIELSYAKSVYWVYAVRVTKEFGITKDALREHLASNGIETRDFFYPPSVHPALKDVIGENEQFPVAEAAAMEGLYLPSGLAITDTAIAQVIDCVREIAHR